jgi:hypothetical protein
MKSRIYIVFLLSLLSHLAFAGSSRQLFLESVCGISNWDVEVETELSEASRDLDQLKVFIEERSSSVQEVEQCVSAMRTLNHKADFAGKLNLKTKISRKPRFTRKALLPQPVKRQGVFFTKKTERKQLIPVSDYGLLKNDSYLRFLSDKGSGLFLSLSIQRI